MENKKGITFFKQIENTAKFVKQLILIIFCTAFVENLILLI